MVSVIIPVYNGEKYIRKCMDSLQLENNTELEVIAVNDGSKDGSLAILHEYAEKHPNLKVIDKENAGAAQARHDGVMAASGDYVAFLDVDDHVAPNLYDTLEKSAVAKDADILVFDYIEEYPTRSSEVKNAFDKEQTFPLQGKDALRYLHRRTAIFPFPWNKLYRTALLREVQFPQGNFVGEDYNMLLQLFGRTDHIFYEPIAGYHYVLTESSVSRRGYSAATVLAYEHFKEDHAFMTDHHPELKKEVTNYLITEYMAMIISMGRNDTYDRPMIKEIKRFVRKGLFGFLGAGYVPVKMKGSAMALCFSYRLLIWMYRFLSK